MKRPKCYEVTYMDKRHPVKACKVRLENPVLPCGHPGKADLLTGLVFISYLGDAYQTQPQTWPGLGLHCLSDCLSLGWSSADVFVPRGLSIEAVAKTTANILHVQQNRSRCWLTCLSLAFLQGRTRRDLNAGGRLLLWTNKGCTLAHILNDNFGWSH